MSIVVSVPPSLEWAVRSERIEAARSGDAATIEELLREPEDATQEVLLGLPRYVGSLRQSRSRFRRGSFLR